jgi:sucrose-6-phosphate hydrolase SacC (GH32 family)
VDGDASTRKWVISGASGEYALGSFDGERFVPETAKLCGVFGTATISGDTANTFYAAQTFSDAPDGRRIQIAWGLAQSPGMPFNMLHLLPCELGLIRTGEGIRLVRTPVRELTSLRDGPDQSKTLEKFSGEAVELRVEIEASNTGVFDADVRGAKITYDAKTLRRHLLRTQPTVRSRYTRAQRQ